MNTNYGDFVHRNHLTVFVAAAQKFNCHILIRETGRAALEWVGKQGFTGKRADMKAKTANRNVGKPAVAGLVCSPFLRPEVFTSDRLADAREMWLKSFHLITVPSNKAGFDDNRQQKGCLTPYLVQTNPSHKYYGCVALIEMGLLLPRYVHGDYDLYAIVPAGKGIDPHTTIMHDPTLESTLGSSMSPDKLGLQEKLNMQVRNFESPMSFKVANYVNTNIAKTSPDLLGSLMVNHGEQVCIGSKGYTYELVLAIMPKQINGESARALTTREEHEQFYRDN